MHVTPRPRRAGARIAALAALTVAGSALTGVHAVAATNGDIKIHDAETGAEQPENDPHVCVFYLAAFNFDPNEHASWTIETQPPSSGPDGASGEITLDSDGEGQSENIELPNGHYKLSFVTDDGDGGPGKQKTFWVDCPSGSPSPTGTPTTEPPTTPPPTTQPPTTEPPTTQPPTTEPPTTQPPTSKPPHHGYPGGPHGGPPAGGGGLARDAAFGPVAGAAAVGVAAVGGVLWFRLRRRTHGAA
ncbi:hypothetical protein [Streptomyces sp. NPDC096132]|uniref:hypothetical protein n=1 Tax=Streptomyces sp. NPDC096132 TaxID=3366075 RepID=UPI003829BE55